MGQAKQRGTRTERIALAVARDKALQEKKDAERAAFEAQERARIAAMSPEERRRYKDRLHRQRMMTATLLGLAYGAMEPFRREGITVELCGASRRRASERTRS